PVLVLYFVLAQAGRPGEGVSPLGLTLLGILLTVLTVAFYAAVVRAGAGFQQGAYPHVLFPAWFVLIAAEVLLLVNSAVALMLVPAVAELPAFPLLLGAGLVGSLALVAVDVLLIVSSAVLVWQS